MKNSLVRLLFFGMFFLLLPLLTWGQVRTYSLSFGCEICGNGVDDDGDGFADCADVDCILALPDGELKRESNIELRSSSCPADLGLTDEQISFIKNNSAYLESMGIHGTVAAQEEAAAIANCIASALVSATLDYSIKWFELSILQDKDLDYFALETAQDIFSNHGVSMGGNAVLACIEGINPFKLGKIEEFLINAGFGAMSGFIEGAESEYNKFQDANCSIDDVILNKMDWGAVFSKAGTQSLITVFTVGIGSRLGPIIRANAVAAGAKIKKWFGEEVWAALQDRFLKNVDELFGGYPNIKNLSDDLEVTLNDLSLSEDAIRVFNEDLGNTDILKYFDEGGDFFEERVKTWQKMLTLNADEAIRKNPKAIDALAASKGSRPDPETYLSPEYIANHLLKFDEGVVRFTTQSNIDEFGSIGSKSAFAIPKKEFDDLLKQTNNDFSAIEEALGLFPGTLTNGDAVIAWVKKEDLGTVKIPSGNERGANDNWLPGGITPGGISEGVVDLSAPDLPFTPYPF